MRPLVDLATSLARSFSIDTFVETGTYQGAATQWAAGVFRTVWTVEKSPQYHMDARARLAELSNVTALLGDSPLVLPEICRALDRPAMFWLDAHAGGGHFGPVDACPLLDELDVVATHGLQHFVLIDDARAFVAPPPPPFDASRWPSLDEVLGHLLARHPYHVVLISDCLVAVPKAARDVVRDYVFTVRPKI